MCSFKSARFQRAASVLRIAVWAVASEVRCAAIGDVHSYLANEARICRAVVSPNFVMSIGLSFQSGGAN